MEPPHKILIVSPTSNGCDFILDLLIPISKTQKIIRFGQSNAREDLNKLFTLNISRDADNSSQLIQQHIAEASIVVAAQFSLHSNQLLNTRHIFDTVLIDDANMISEADVITSLCHGTKRAILFYNKLMDFGMFLINPSINKSITNRILNCVDI